MLKVLSTKLLDESLIKTARKMGIDLRCEEFIRVIPIDFDISALMSIQFDAMVFTSSNAVRSFFDNENVPPQSELLMSPNEDVESKPVFAVAGKTKDELIDLGIEPRASADNALLLADQILADPSIRSVIHICGNLKLDVLETKLAAAGVKYTPFMVCETLLSSKILEETYDVVMFFSPSGVDSLTMKNQLSRDVIYCCIGETTADSIRKIDAGLTIILPDQPSPEAMLAAIMKYKKQTK